ncbi:MAG: beta-ketoacyl-ACP synthase I, partial [Paracoccaceae bacterium]|nr:beta-ketoacyl-ACP synthase I [Paracoccaceae bacterium]
CLLMLENDFIAPSINIDNLDPELKPFEIANSLVTDAKLDTVMTNSFGFGGTNATLIFEKV